MAVDERSRHALQGRLEQVLGADHAETLMSHLREIGTGEVVTKTYLDERLLLSEERILRTVREDVHTEVQGVREEVGALRSEVRQEISGLRGEFHEEISGLRGEMHGEISGLRGEFQGLRGEFEGLRSEVHEEISGLRGEMHGEMRGLYGEFNRQTRVLLFSLFGANATFAGLVFAAVRFV